MTPPPGSRVWLRVAAILAAWLALPLPGRGAPPRAEPSLAGEAGLWVEWTDGAITVHWITARPGPGYLRVTEGRRVRELRTDSAVAHAAVYRPRTGRVVLHYGSDRDPADRHETELRLRPERPVVSVGRVDSVFVSADVHGSYEEFLALLRNAGLVDPGARWSGGRSHLVLLGDLMDRGPDVTRLLWLVYRLEEEAERAGGRVHVLLGNHELMVMSGDLRYVSPREARLAELHATPYPRLFHPRHSLLGRWLATKPAVLRLDRALFAHGGVTRQGSPESLAAHHDSLTRYLHEEWFVHWSDTTYLLQMDSAAFARRYDFFWGEQSVFWHRGYVQSDTLEAELAAVLRAFRSDLLVVGHTPVPTITPRYGGALVAAHPRTPAAELLLLTRAPDGARRLFRYRPTGPPAPLPWP